MQRISKILVKSFNMKPEETTKFILLFFHSFFVGLFIAFYFVQANTVFINNYGSEQLPIAYMVAGIVGYLSSSLYSYIQQKVKSKYLFSGALLFMFTITIIARFGLKVVEEQYLSFFVFIWAWPFISIVGIESGGLALRLLNLIQVKRLFGLVNMGGVIASILGYLIIPVLNRIIGSSYNLLFIAAASLLAAIVLLYFIYKNFPDNYAPVKKTKTESKTGFRYLIKQKYFRLIFISATLSMTVIYLTDFGFLSAIKVQVNMFKEEGSVASFLALVFAGLKIGELFISYFSSRILSKWGVKLGLTILPLTITLIVAISAVTGFTIGAVSVIFLILMILNKSMERIFRRGLDDPAFNILYQPLHGSQRFAVQSKVGIVMQFAIGIAGVLLFLLNLALKSGGGFKLEFFPLFFLPILFLWVIIAWRLYLSYKNKLREILKEMSKKRERDTSKYLYGTEVLTKKFKKFNENVVNLSVTILSETNPRMFEPYVGSLLKKNDPLIQKAILRSIDPTWRTRILKQTKKIYEESQSVEIKELADRANYLLDFSEIDAETKNNIDNLINSREQKDKLKLIKYITKNEDPERSEEIILNLLKYKDKAIKNAAIKLAVNYKTEKVINKLIYLLGSPLYYHISTTTILDIGDRTLNYLEKLFKNTSEKDIVLKIIEIYAKMGSKKAKSLLVEALNYPDKKIRLAVIWALYYCKYQAPEEEEAIIKQKIIDVTGNLIWIIASIKDIEEEKNTLKLFLALDQERVVNTELLFNLLSFLHDSRVISLIKKNIIGKNTIYALELVDNFIQQDIKQYIVPIFDDITDNQKIKKLTKLFPQKKLNLRQRLQSLITRDFDKLDTWTIAKTLEMIGKIHRIKVKKERIKKELINYEDVDIWTKDNIQPVLNQIKRSELPDEVFLCLFHTDELVYSTAAKIIFEENSAKCIDYLSKMNDNKKKLMKTLTEGGFLITDKVKLLRRYQLFFSIPDYQLVRLAKIVRPKIIKKGEKISINYKGFDNIIILIGGALIHNEGMPDEYTFNKKVIIIPGVNIEQNTKYLVADKKSTVLFVKRHKYFNLLVDQAEMLQSIFEIIQK